MSSISLSWRRAVLVLFLAYQTIFANTDAPCYMPNGTLAPGFFPCDPTAYITSCCQTGWTCYSNSMCVVTDPSTANSSHPIGTSMRGSCTNPIWNNAICGDFCLKDSDVDGSLKACGDNKFCCANDQSCACSSGAFNVNPGRVQTIIGIEGLEHTETSTILGKTSTTAFATRTSATTLSIATTAMSVTSRLSQTPTAAPAERKTIDKPGVKAGVAFAVILSVVLLGFLAWLIYKRFFSGTQWRSRNRVEVQPTSTPMGPSMALDPYVPGNAMNLALSPPTGTIGWKAPENFDSGDAPYGNAYERGAPSRGPLANSATTLGTGTLSGAGGYNGPPAMAGRPLSFVSDEGPGRYTRPTATEMGI